MSSVCKPSSGAIVRVGILHSQTGTMALSEQPLVDVALMAIAEINETGGVLGCPIEPLILDGASEPEGFACQTRRAIQQSCVVTLFGCWTSHARKAVKPILEELNVLLWYPLQYEGLESSPNIFYTGSCPNQQIEPAIAWLLQQNYQRFYLLGSDYVFPRTVHKLIRSQIKQQSGEIVGEKFLALGTKNFLQTIADIRIQRPDAIVNTLNGDSNPNFYRQYRDAGITADEIPILATSVSEAELQEIGSAAKGHYACWSYFQSLERAENQTFIKNFRTRYGPERVTSDPIASAYSQVYLWKQAVETARTFAVDRVRTAAIGQQFASPGGQIAIAPNHHVSKPCYIGKATAAAQFEIIDSSPTTVQPLPWLGFEGLDFNNTQTVIDLLAEVSEGLLQSALNEQKSHELQAINQQLQQEILDRRLTELALAESQAILSTLMNNLPGMAYHCLNDEHLTMLFVSDGCQELTGYTVEDFTVWQNITYQHLIRPQDREIVRTAVKIALDSRTSFQVIYGITTASGEFKWVWEQGRGIFDSIGQLLYLEGFIADVTVRVRAQEALVKSEERWQLALRGNNDGIFDLNYQTGEVFYSPRWKEMLGYEEEEIPNHHDEWKSRIHPDDYDRVIAADCAHLARETPYFCEEYRLRCKDGRYKWVLGRGQALWDKEGNPTRMVGSHTDITARKQTEEALCHEQQKSEQLLLNILPEAIVHQLKNNRGAIAEHFDDVSILFADIVGFTSLSSQLSPIELVNLLNEIFSSFDVLAERFGLEKIKTIGDAYMVAAGLPIPRADHAEAIAKMALAMQEAIASFQKQQDNKIQIRIGINSGAAVAGAIGTKKFIYDLWGDAVNIASRMESSGKPGKIQVTVATYERLKHRHILEKRGSVYIKGKGEMVTYWLLE